MAALHKQLEELQCRRKAIPYVDPFDIRYNRFDMRPEPKTNAVMFCLMDVSGSMGEREKDLAKRFFILLAHVPEAPLRAHRGGLRAPHPRSPGGRRGDLLLQPRDRRHGGFSTALKEMLTILKRSLSAR